LAGSTTQRHPEEIVQTLAIEGAAIGWHELLVQVDPGAMPPAKALKVLERLALEVLPYLKTVAPRRKSLKFSDRIDVEAGFMPALCNHKGCGYTYVV
jgi:hypothetical protein